MKTLVPVALALLTTVSGCMLAPGQHLDRSALLDKNDAESSMVELVSITPKLLAVQSAERSAEQIPDELLAFQPGPYRIGAGDILHVTVWEHPELTVPSGQQQQPEANGRIVHADGTLFFPYAGSVKAGGATLAELRATLTSRLTKWLEQPQVDVAVIRYNSAKVQFSGAFEKAAEQPITQTPLTLLAALGAAGIKTAEADLTGLTLKRDGREFRLDLDALNRGRSNLDAVYLKHGDHIHLPYNDRRKAYVMGEVLRPTTITFKARSISLTEALGNAGGMRQETSDGNAVYVIRGIDDVEQRPVRVFQLEAKSPVAFALASQFEVMPRDVVFVGPADITRWNRVITQLIPTGSLLRTGTDLEADLRTR